MSNNKNDKQNKTAIKLEINEKFILLFNNKAQETINKGFANHEIPGPMKFNQPVSKATKA